MSIVYIDLEKKFCKILLAQNNIGTEYICCEIFDYLR